MTTHEKAREAAIQAANEISIDGAPVPDYVDAIISAYLSTLTPPDVAGRNLQAALTARAKTMLRLRDALSGVHDGIEDEGDRVYFGSTNDAETLKSVWQDLDGWAWDYIMADGSLPDVYESSRKAHAEVDRLTAETASLASENALLRAREGWLPIETAPKDVDILVGEWMDGEWKCSVYRIRNEFWREEWDDLPTHWRSLPASPSHREQST